MTKIYRLFKIESDNLKNFVQSILGYFTMSVGVAAFFVKILESKYGFAIISIGIFFLLNRVCNGILKGKKESFGVCTEAYPKKWVKAASYAKIINYGFWLVPIYIGVTSYMEKRSCANSQNLGVVITNFTNSDNDVFSAHLFQKLQPEIPIEDSINVMRVNGYIRVGDKNYTDSMKNIFSDNCLSHGLLVCGKRDLVEKVFDCDIFIYKLGNLHQSTMQFKDRDLVYLQNPDLIHFSIDSQVTVVSDFILGLLYYNGNNYNASKEKLEKALMAYSNNDDKQFLSYCHLFIGNDFYKTADFDQANAEYKKGLEYDSTNAYLHYNLANSLLMTYDFAEAKKQYKIAQRSNGRLHNYILDTLSETNLAEELKAPPTAGTYLTVKTIHARSNDKSPLAFKKVDTLAISKFHAIFMNGRYGLADSNGEIILKCAFDSIYPNEVTCNKKHYFVVKKDDMFGAVNDSGKIQIPFSYSSAEQVINTIKFNTNNSN